MSYEAPPQSPDWSFQWKKWLSGFHRHTEERGTWTPVYEGATTNPSSVTYDIQAGEYIRHGSMVTIWFEVGTDALTVGSGNLQLTGLPFVCSSLVTPLYTPVASWAFVGADSTYNSARPVFMRISDGDNFLVFFTADRTQVDASATYLNTTTNDNRISGYLTYSI
ncbi:MAG: hypothetical protein GY938_32685 [Ketobacter sp.]|nr:hypothetical protein [Ketobacter sp.]